METIVLLIKRHMFDFLLAGEGNIIPIVLNDFLKSGAKPPEDINITSLSVTWGGSLADLRVFRRDKVIQVGNYDPFFVRGQDIELNIRLSTTDIRSMTCKELRFFHLGLIGPYSKVLSRAQTFRFFYKYGVGYMLLGGRHARRLAAFLIRSCVLFSTLYIVAGGLIGYTIGLPLLFFLCSLALLFGGVTWMHGFVPGLYIVQLGKCIGEYYTICKILRFKGRQGFGYGRTFLPEHKMKQLNSHRARVYLLILFVLGTIWRMYPHMFLVPSIFPGDEHTTVSYVLWLMEHGGSANPFHNPHLEFYLTYAVCLLTRADPVKICFIMNPIIGGLSVLSFYYFATNVMSEKKALVAASIFTFSEAHFYRTCNFTSTEALGIFLMFLFLGLYGRKKYRLAAVVLVTIPFAHTLPFIFSVSFTVIHVLMNKGNKLYALTLCVLTILLYASPLKIHIPQSTRIIVGMLSSFSWKNVFVYSSFEILSFLPCFSGIVIMSVVTLPRFKEWNGINKLLLFICVMGMGVSILCYRYMSPVRFLVYITIPLTLTFAERVESKKVLAILIVIMVATPYAGGLDKMMWISDSITTEEIDAVEWLIEQGYFNLKTDPTPDYVQYGRRGDWFYDTTVNKYVILRSGSWMKYRVFLNYKYKNASWIKITNMPYQPSYVFLSERMKRGAFIHDRGEGRADLRPTILNVPIEDIWRGDSRWKEIYNKNGVVIYENLVFAANRRKSVGD